MFVQCAMYFAGIRQTKPAMEVGGNEGIAAGKQRKKQGGDCCFYGVEEYRMSNRPSNAGSDRYPPVAGRNLKSFLHYSEFIFVSSQGQARPCEGGDASHPRCEQ